MITRLLALIRDGIKYLQLHPQFILTLVLIIVIPLGFLVSGQQFLKAAQLNQERLEKDRLGLMHDVFASFLTAVNFESSTVQSHIEYLGAQNPDITKFRVAQEAREGVVPIAALNVSEVGIPETNDAAYRLARVHENESIIVAYDLEGVRHWQSFRLVTAPDGSEYYIFTETSLEQLDVLFAARVRTAYYWLFGILTVVLLLVIRHVRLIDYSYLYAETKKAIATKDMFTNMIAHELRAPLTAMRGYASLIAEDSTLDQGTREHASRISVSAERLVLIVNDLLDVARIQSGKLSVLKEPFAVGKIIGAVIEEEMSTAKEKGIELESEGTHTTITVLGDEKRLHQALTNLVSNALKYTKEGKITVALEDRSDRVAIRVKDTGMGIEAEDQKQLFAPFFRVANSDVSQITGTGLGMWITKQLIELMGGSIGVESIKGVGTHVVVTLPKN